MLLFTISLIRWIFFSPLISGHILLYKERRQIVSFENMSPFYNKLYYFFVVISYIIYIYYVCLNICQIQVKKRFFFSKYLKCSSDFIFVFEIPEFCFSKIWNVGPKSGFLVHNYRISVRNVFFLSKKSCIFLDPF